MEVKSIFRTYNVDFTNETPPIGKNDVLVIDKMVFSLYENRYTNAQNIFMIEAVSYTHLTLPTKA